MRECLYRPILLVVEDNGWCVQLFTNEFERGRFIQETLNHNTVPEMHLPSAVTNRIMNAAAAVVDQLRG